MTFFLILAVVAGALAIACAWADSKPPAEHEPFHDISHCTVIKDQEPAE